jgi:hypothetical protein
MENAMPAQTLSQLQESSPPALPGTWKLGAGRAITLRPKEDGVLRIAHGRLWATFDGPHGGPPNDQGDEILGVGDQLRLRAGQRLVVEAWDARAPAYFSWDPVPQAVASASLSFAPVLQPLADLRLAAVFGAGAAARLLAGLAALALGAVSGRASRADCAFNAQSRACRAHGAMS